jgi:hypothetical protein
MVLIAPFLQTKVQSVIKLSMSKAYLLPFAFYITFAPRKKIKHNKNEQHHLYNA